MWRYVTLCDLFASCVQYMFVHVSNLHVHVQTYIRTCVCEAILMYMYILHDYWYTCTCIILYMCIVHVYTCMNVHVCRQILGIVHLSHILHLFTNLRKFNYNSHTNKFPPTKCRKIQDTTSFLSWIHHVRVIQGVSE